VTKHCCTEQQRLEHGVLLGGVMPAKGDTKLEAISKRVGFKYGKRKGRLRAASKAHARRVEFDAAAQVKRPLQVGDAVLCRGTLGELAALEAADGKGRCAVIFRSGGEEARVDYTYSFGKKDGKVPHDSARLQRPPPTLMPPSRDARSDSVDAETREHVREVRAPPAPPAPSARVPPAPRPPLHHPLVYLRQLSLQPASLSQVYEAVCATSPYQKDSMKRRLAPHVVQTAPALIQTSTFDEMYDIFCKTYPLDKLSLAQFKMMKPWNPKKAYRETCLCRLCELFSLYVAALHKVAEVLAPLVVSFAEEVEPLEVEPHEVLEPEQPEEDDLPQLLSPEESAALSDGEDIDESLEEQQQLAEQRRAPPATALPAAANAPPVADALPMVNPTAAAPTAAPAVDAAAAAATEPSSRRKSDEALASLVSFCGYNLKSMMVQDLVCGGRLDTAKPACVAGTCQHCGFKKLWQPVRKTVVDAFGKLRDGAPAAWQTKIRYEVLKSGGSTPSDGSTSEDKETLRERREATIVEFLDEFEKASVKFPAHRHHVGAAKAAALQRDRNFAPGMLLSDYDWSENGVIASARQIQSEYWSLVHYSLFIQITTYLVSEAWLDRRSILPQGAEVTVETASETFGELQPCSGAFYAKVKVAAEVEGESAMYSVEVFGHETLTDGTVIDGIPRERLRHRKKKTTATIGITDEKRHDSVTTQHFLDKQFEHWRSLVDLEQFWGWVGHSDNASHFKSGAMMHYWSNKMSEIDFMKMCWIDFGCPGHGTPPPASNALPL